MSGLCECGCGQATSIAAQSNYKFVWQRRGQPYRFICGHNLRRRCTVVTTNTGYCECGCGQRTALATHTSAKYGRVRGQPLRFINGHQMQGPLNGRWRGGVRNRKGYVSIWKPDHPHAVGGHVLEHRLIVEKAIGKLLRLDAPVHHVNVDPADNRPGNLVACNDHAYHMLLHQRQRAYDACGHAHWRRCTICKQYDDPRILYVRDVPEGNAHHRSCAAKRRREENAQRRASCVA